MCISHRHQKINHSYFSKFTQNAKQKDGFFSLMCIEKIKVNYTCCSPVNEHNFRVFKPEYFLYFLCINTVPFTCFWTDVRFKNNSHGQGFGFLHWVIHFLLQWEKNKVGKEEKKKKNKENPCFLENLLLLGHKGWAGRAEPFEEVSLQGFGQLWDAHTATGIWFHP